MDKNPQWLHPTQKAQDSERVYRFRKAVDLFLRMKGINRTFFVAAAF